MSLPDLPRKAYNQSILWSDFNAVRDWLLAAFGVNDLVVKSGVGYGTDVYVTCAQALLLAAGGVMAVAEDVDVTIDLSTTGANALDAGSLATDTLYYIWLIGKDLDELVYDEGETGSSFYATGTVFTNGSATFGITDTETDLEDLYETLSGQSPYWIEITDDGGKKASGYIRGIAASGDNYTLSIFDDAAGSNQNWDKEGGFNESAATYTYDIKTRDGVIENAAGLASTSATAPSLPAGYTHKKRIGAFRTDSTPEVYPFEQRMEEMVYIAEIEIISETASVGDTEFDLSSWVPAEAQMVDLAGEIYSTTDTCHYGLKVRSYGAGFTFLSQLRLYVGANGQGGANAKNWRVPVRTNGGTPYINYYVGKYGTNTATVTLDVAGFVFPLTAEV